MEGAMWKERGWLIQMYRLIFLTFCIFLVGCSAEKLCEGEAPEGPGLVNDTEHLGFIGFPDTVAPAAVKEAEQLIEMADYPECVKWCKQHPGRCK
jgi:hypothetical protein